MSFVGFFILILRVQRIVMVAAGLDSAFVDQNQNLTKRFSCLRRSCGCSVSTRLRASGSLAVAVSTESPRAAGEGH